ncbi:glycan-binding surface protein [Bacteroides sp.]|uniref:glycan-binding surface protein n=1 Tax=Bacteroides sp. TaxID=29523 RepID=UPI002639534E|nr:glycan-binding surface protein [Bacteroides sp.]MDD3036845.1 glycan-binding surface protein [Bacteroides sp.]
MKITYLKHTVFALFTSLTTISCSDVVNMDEGWDADLGANGAPVVRKITASSDTTKAISVASLNQSIAIFGDNLARVTEVLVNDISLDLSQVYTKRHRLEIVVPRVLPGTVTNTLTIKTALGEITTPLNVTLPELKIKGFSNDFAADGDTVEVLGSDFDLYKIDSISASVKFNNQDIRIFNCSQSGFSIEVPEGTSTDETSYLTISTPELDSPAKIPFREKGIAILTNDDRTWSDGWWPTGIVPVNPDSDPAAPLFKWYVTLKKTYTGAWQYDNIMITHFWLDDTAADLLANPENYYVKMEILNPAEVPLARYIKIGNGDLEGDGLIYNWDPASTNNGVSLNTMGKWQTVSLEVTDVFKGKDGNKTSLKIAKKPYEDKGERINLKMAMNRELAGDMEFYFWNLRFVKKIKVE